MKDKIFADVAAELYEIFNYLDYSILEKIPNELKEHIYNIKNNNYTFKLDKSKALIEQNLLQETKQILSVIFLKYCCTQNEVDEILEKHLEIEKKIEDSKVGLDDLQNYFNKHLKNNEEIEESKEIIKIEDTSWYIRLINKIKKFFRIK